MKTRRTAPPRSRHAQLLLGTALALIAAVAAPEGPGEAQEGQSADSAKIQREEPLARVGLTPEFSATLDTAPAAANWQLLRETLAVRYEPGKSEKLDPGTRKHLVVHAAVIKGGQIQRHHTSEPAELLPGATKLDPDAFLPEESLVPSGYRISNLMSIGEIEVEPGRIMTDLVRDVVADMTKNAPALYLAATPPEEQAEGSHKIHPILVQLAPAPEGGGAGSGGGGGTGG